MGLGLLVLTFFSVSGIPRILALPQGVHFGVTPLGARWLATQVRNRYVSVGNFFVVVLVHEGAGFFLVFFDGRMEACWCCHGSSSGNPGESAHVDTLLPGLIQVLPGKWFNCVQRTSVHWVHCVAFRPDVWCAAAHVAHRPRKRSTLCKRSPGLRFLVCCVQALGCTCGRGCDILFLAQTCCRCQIKGCSRPHDGIVECDFIMCSSGSANMILGLSPGFRRGGLSCDWIDLCMKRPGSCLRAVMRLSRVYPGHCCAARGCKGTPKSSLWFIGEGHGKLTTLPKRKTTYLVTTRHILQPASLNPTRT